MKKYIKPTVDVVNLEEECAILSGSGTRTMTIYDTEVSEQSAILKDGARGRNYEW